MNMSRILRSSLALGVAGFLGLLTYSAVHAVNYAEEAAYSRDLRRVQAATAELNERVLKARSALMVQYDPLVHALHDLRDLHERLKHVPDFLGADAALEMRAQLEESETQLRQKDELVESFKSQNSVLQNSLHYFPVLANSMIDRARAHPTGAEVANRIQALIGAIMLFDTAADSESTSRVLSAQLDLSTAMRAAHDLQLDRELELILSHSRIILERKPVTDGLVHQI
ncbi:MAG TPA: DAHL domain-containing protein, partial [Polyangiaceae bacterium]|nr:DAHL domain-containing protein [Polyangiaceae bacterium]